MIQAVMSNKSSEMRLNQLARKCRGIVQRVESQDDDMERLMAMGLCGGREVEVIRAGNPLLIRVLGSRIGVSSELADRVVIQPC